MQPFLASGEASHPRVCFMLVSQNRTDGLQRAVLQEEKEKNVVPITKSVLGDLEPGGEAWECVNELEPGLALRGQAVPLRPGTD